MRIRHVGESARQFRKLRNLSRAIGMAFIVAFALPPLFTAEASVLLLPPSVAPEALSEAVPTAFAPADFSTDDFTLEWSRSTELGGISAAFEAGSLEWVRVSEVLVVPRARVIVRASGIRAGISGGTVRYGGFTQPFVVDEGGAAEVRIPVALVSGEEHPIEIAVNRAGQQEKGKYLIRFRRGENGPGERTPVVLFDSSCSRFGLAAEWITPNRGGSHWSYIGCRMVHTEAENYRTASLEVVVFWDNIGQSLKVSGIATPASSASVWQLRLRSEPGFIDLGVPVAGSESAEYTLRLRYRIPRRLHRGAIGLGVGPYAFSFSGGPGGQEKIRSWTMMPTLYASFFITETMRVVAFDATTLNSQFISDFGVYLSTEYLRSIDRRVVINLMLGLHSIGFRSEGRYNFLLGAPQGFEVIISDFLGRARNLTLGGFIYPSIQGKAYYNTWVRWGSPSLFGEVNYISWQEELNQAPYSSSSFGLTIGMPLPMLGFL